MSLRRQRSANTAFEASLHTHCVMLVCILAATLIAALRPEWLQVLPVRSQLLQIFGIKCPFCGMTRDFVSIWHHQNAVLNPGSWAAAITVYTVYPILIVWASITRRLDIFQHPVLRATVFSAVALLWIANNLHR